MKNAQKTSILGMAGIIVYLCYQFFNDSIYDAMNNAVIILLIYNSFLIIGGNIINKRKSKAEITFNTVIIIMTIAGSYWWLKIKGFL